MKERGEIRKKKKNRPVYRTRRFRFDDMDYLVEVDQEIAENGAEKDDDEVSN